LNTFVIKEPVISAYLGMLSREHGDSATIKENSLDNTSAQCKSEFESKPHNVTERHKDNLYPRKYCNRCASVSVTRT
jgi:hypothetical protein